MKRVLLLLVLVLGTLLGVRAVYYRAPSAVPTAAELRQHWAEAPVEPTQESDRFQRQRKAKPSARKPTPRQQYDYGIKTQLSAFLLCLLVGWLGMHRFYLGYVGLGILQLLTLGCCGVFIVVDLIWIASGSLRDRSGKRLIPW